MFFCVMNWCSSTPKNALPPNRVRESKIVVSWKKREELGGVCHIDSTLLCQILFLLDAVCITLKQPKKKILSAEDGLVNRKEDRRSLLLTTLQLPLPLITLFDWNFADGRRSMDVLSWGDALITLPIISSLHFLQWSPLSKPFAPPFFVYFAARIWEHFRMGREGKGRDNNVVLSSLSLRERRNGNRPKPQTSSRIPCSQFFFFDFRIETPKSITKRKERLEEKRNRESRREWVGWIQKNAKIPSRNDKIEKWTLPYGCPAHLSFSSSNKKKNFCFFGLLFGTGEKQQNKEGKGKGKVQQRATGNQKGNVGKTEEKHFLVSLLPSFAFGLSCDTNQSFALHPA